MQLGSGWEPGEVAGRHMVRGRGQTFRIGDDHQGAGGDEEVVRFGSLDRFPGEHEGRTGKRLSSRYGCLDPVLPAVIAGSTLGSPRDIEHPDADREHGGGRRNPGTVAAAWNDRGCLS